MKKRPICQMAAVFIVGLLTEYSSIPKSQLMRYFPDVPWEIFSWLFFGSVVLAIWGIAFVFQVKKVKKIGLKKANWGHKGQKKEDLKNKSFWKMQKVIFRKAFILASCLLLGQTVMREAATSYLPVEISEGCLLTITGRIKKYEIKNQQIYYYLSTNVIYHDVMVMAKLQNSTSPTIDNSQAAIGMTIQATGTLWRFSTPTNEGQFNQWLYYKSQNIDFSIRNATLKIVDGKKNPLTDSLHQLQQYLSEQIQRLAGDVHGGILAAMLFGDKTSMDSMDKKLYQRHGIAHVMSISGLHISILGLGLYKLLCKCPCPKWMAAILGGVFVVLFGVLTGMSVSTFRAVVMYILTMVARVCGRTYDLPSAVAFAAMLVLLERPYALFQSSMQFSFGAVLALILYEKQKREGLGKTIYKKIPSFLEGLFVSSYIQLVTLPIQLYHTFYFSICSSLLNLFVIPTMSILLSLGMIAALWSVIFQGTLSYVSHLLIFPCKWLLCLYELLCQLAEKIPGSVQVFGQPAWWQILLYYMALAAFYWGVTTIKRSVGYGFLLLPICMVLLLRPMGGSGLKITMLDVGQGESICLQLPNNRVILSDGGSTDVSKVGIYRIKPFLLANGISVVDAVLVSHWDDDHISGIEELLTEEPGEIEIKTLVLPQTAEKEKKLLTLIEMAEREGVDIQYVKRGDRCTFGDAILTCLWPRESLVAEDGNDYSAVFHVSYDQFQMLLTGDLPGKHEEELLKNANATAGEGDCGFACEVLKVAHHGSKYSTSLEFLEKVQPKVALISCGEDNVYGHPHKELLERLEEAGCKVMTVAKDGAVTVEVGRKISVKSWKQEMVGQQRGVKPD